MDLCIAWIGLSSVHSAELTREQVTRAAAAKGISVPGLMDFGTTRSFTHAAGRLRHPYVDDHGRRWCLVAEASRERSDVTASATVMRVPDDASPAGPVGPAAKPTKLAEVTCRKRAPNQPLMLRWTIRKNLLPPDRAAARTWIKQFEKGWTESDVEPTMGAIRKLARRAMVDAQAWPASRARQGVWFVYADHAHHVERVLEFMAEISPILDGACLPVELKPAHLAMAGELCDEFLTEQAQSMLRVIRQDAEGKHLSTARLESLAARRAGGRPREDRTDRHLERITDLLDLCMFHEKRLWTEMSTTRHWCRVALDVCEEMQI